MEICMIRNIKIHVRLSYFLIYYCSAKISYHPNDKQNSKKSSDTIENIFNRDNN